MRNLVLILSVFLCTEVYAKDLLFYGGSGHDEFLGCFNL